VLGRLDHANLVERPAFEAPPIVQPRDGVRFDDVLAGLDASRAALLDVVGQLEHVDATRVTARHAALGELDAYQWLLFLGLHERRHLRQLDATARDNAVSTERDSAVG
jgi:hypothetical protein